jgi:hypothetical protein
VADGSHLVSLLYNDTRAATRETVQASTSGLTARWLLPLPVVLPQTREITPAYSCIY